MMEHVKNCGGAGYIEYSTDYDTTIKVECKECDGTGFNKELKKYKIMIKIFLIFGK